MIFRIKSDSLGRWNTVGRSFVLMSVLLGGCGPTGPQTMPVSGTVSLKGQPLTSGIVRFNPVDPQKGRPAEATLEKNGAFAMSSFKPGDGVIAGDYSITVPATLENSEALAKDKGTGIGGKSAIPEKYSNPKTSGLKQTVSPSAASKL